MANKLKLHPTSRCQAVTAITAEIVCPKPGTLRLTYRIEGTLAGVAWPHHSPPARMDDLWHHTCFEAFIGTASAPAYQEFNLAPSTSWAAYSFTSYRDGMANTELPWAPRMTTDNAAGVFTLTAECPILLPTPWRIGVTTVLEETNGNKSYWALAHPSPKPDFHNAAGFTVELS
jgi:hypothetical protein